MMIKYILATAFCFILFSSAAKAEDGYKIEIELSNYPETEIIIGYYHGKQTLIKDTLRSENQHFVLEGEGKLDPGIYLLLVKPDNKYAQFLVNEDDQTFKIKTDAENLDKIKFSGSEENKLFYDYLKYLKDQRTKVDKIKLDREKAKTEQKDTLSFDEALKKLDKKVLKEQKLWVEKHPNRITSSIIKSSFPLDPPAFEGTKEEKELAKYTFFKNHYFDYIDFEKPYIIRTPFMHQKVEYYVNKLTPKHPDSINLTIDKLLEKFEPNEDLYSYYLSYFLNTYARSRIVGMDAVYVHIAEKYYANGKATWVEEKDLNKIVNKARRIKKVLIGKKAPDFTLYKEDGSPVGLNDIDADYRVLFFWAPDCGHCKKAIPHIREFYKIYKDRGVELLSICNKTGDKYGECWKAIKEKGMEEFLNLGDQYQKSRILSNYYVTGTPKIFIINREQEIIMKGIGGEQLGLIMEELMKMDEEKKAELKGE